MSPSCQNLPMRQEAKAEGSKTSAKKKVHPERQTFERGDSTQDSND
jgi:hypothetical protein